MFVATFLQILEHLYMLRRFLKVMLLDCQTALIQDVILKVIKAQQLVMEFILSTQTLEKPQCVLKIQKNLENGVILVSLQNSKVRVESNVADLNLDTSKYISSKVSLAVLIARTDTLNRPGYTGYALCLFWIHGKWCTQIFVPDSANNSLKIRSCSNDGTWSDWMNIK